MEPENTDFPDREAVEAGLAGTSLKCFCPECGGEVIQNGRGRPKKFCSERCRLRWQSKHQCPPLRKTAVERTCPVCGKPFLTDRLNSRPRKFCSRACANMARRKHGEWKNGIWVNEAEVGEMEGSGDAGSS